MITLYGLRAAPFTEKVVRGLAFKRLDFELVEPQCPEDYRRWNPENGMLPAIDIDGEHVHDSTDILLRVNELVPEPPLLSSDPRTAENQLRLGRWVDETFFWYWSRWMQLAAPEGPTTPPVSGESLAEAASRSAEAELPRPAGVSLRSWIASRVQRQPVSAKSSEEQSLAHEVGRRVDDVARLLTSRSFFYADRISIADLAAYAMLCSISLDSIPGTRSHLERYPTLREFMRRVENETSR